MMKILLEKLLIMLLVACGGFSVVADTSSALLWWVNDPLVAELPIESGNTSYVSELVSRPDGLHVTDARVRVTGGSISDDSPVYLSLAPQLGGTSGTGGIHDETFLTVTHNPLTEADKAGPVWAWLAGFDAAEYSFYVELGNWNGDTATWTVMAVSDTWSREKLNEFISTDGLNHPGMTPWAPSYAVPEPSSGILLLVGGALLALKRRKNRI